MTLSTEYNYKDCEKIDGRKVNAFVEAHLNPENVVDLVIESTWGDSVVDLTDAVKAAETVTHMELGSNAIEYFAEDGHVDCIYGDDLSRIISMHLLKDVDITTPPADGDVYIFDENTNKFVPFNLTQALSTISGNITNVNALINAIRSRVTNLEQILTKPANVPSDVKVAWGNRNTYFDYTGANLKAHGIYTHDPNTDLADDTFFE